MGKLFLSQWILSYFLRTFSPLHVTTLNGSSSDTHVGDLALGRQNQENGVMIWAAEVTFALRIGLELLI